MNLLDSPKVQKDLRNYENAVKKIVNTNIKQDFEKLLIEYKLQITTINDLHSSSTPGEIKPSSIQEHVKGLGQLRNKLDKLVADSR